MADDEDKAPSGHLRSPVLEDGQPRFPWWLPLPGELLALIWAAYVAATGDDGAAGGVRALLWPGPALALATTAVAYGGWRLDLD
jgi:hypothetical protein